MERQKWHKIADRPKAVREAGLMYTAEMTVRDIARELNVSYGAAYNLVRDSGVGFRKRSARRAA